MQNIHANEMLQWKKNKTPQVFWLCIILLLLSGCADFSWGLAL
jgi:hypothetical protein